MRGKLKLFVESEVPLIKNEQVSIEKIRREHCCLAICGFLIDLRAMAANDRVLTTYLRELALTTTIEETRLCLGRLEQVGAVSIKKIDDVLVVELRQAGANIAQGLIVVDGVLKPEPELPY